MNVEGRKEAAESWMDGREGKKKKERKTDRPERQAGRRRKGERNGKERWTEEREIKETK